MASLPLRSFAALVGAALLAACTTAPQSSPAPTPAETTPADEQEVPAAEAEYVASALEVLREHFYRPDAVDWPEVEDVAVERLRANPTRVGAYGAISAAVSRIGDRHTRFRTPGRASTAQAGEGVAPMVELVAPNVAAIRLPAVAPGLATFDRYAAEALVAIDDVAAQHPICGWIVDVRGNGGGSMYPPLAAVAPLLAEQQALSFRSRDGSTETIVAFDDLGRMTVDGLPAAEALTEAGDDDHATAMDLAADTSAPARPRDAVAVLHDRETASAAEAVVVAFIGRKGTRSFGQPTNGVPTAPRHFELDDGAVLLVTVAAMQDRAGTAYTDPLAPDHVSDVPQDDALGWLANDAGCAT